MRLRSDSWAERLIWNSFVARNRITEGLSHKERYFNGTGSTSDEFRRVSKRQ
jgi:hypothetical protein